MTDRPPSAGAGPGEVDVAQAARLADAGEVLLLDVREPHEWVAGHAPSAVHVPLGRLREDLVPRDRPIAVVCHLGGRSERAAQALAAAGYEVRNVVGGMDAWAARGLPVITDDGAPGRVV